MNKMLILAVATMMVLFFAAHIAECHQAVESCACDQTITKISAIHDLLSGMNAAAPVSTRYAFIDPGVDMGSDEIMVDLVYRLQAVSSADFQRHACRCVHRSTDSLAAKRPLCGYHYVAVTVKGVRACSN